MAEVAVIGANGFIGSHLVDELVASGHDVTAFDRFSSAEPTFDTDRATIMRGDFLSRADIDEAVRGKRFVLHFLSTTNPATAENDPTLDIRTNVAQTVELLESCVEAGVERVYFASTGGAIYGNQARARFTEDDPTLPVSPYGIGKLTIERYLDYFRAKHGLESVSFRISNPYGTRQHPHRKQGLIPIALDHVRHGRPVTQLGDGSMIRDYLFVRDLVKMVSTVVGAPAQHPVYNVGSGVGHSVSSVLDEIRDITGVDFVRERRPAPPTFVPHVVLDTSRYEREFGRPALTTLHDGIEATYKALGG